LIILVTPDGTKYKTTLREVSLRKIIQEDRDPKSKRLITLATHEVDENDQLISV
jgi:hypothetical protein